MLKKIVFFFLKWLIDLVSRGEEDKLESSGFADILHGGQQWQWILPFLRKQQNI